MVNTFHILRTYWKESVDFKEFEMDDCNSQPDQLCLLEQRMTILSKPVKAILHGKDISDLRSAHHCLLFIEIQPIDHTI